MELTIERTDTGYLQDIMERHDFIIREPAAIDYASAAVLLLNLAERKDTTSLERGALSAAIQLLHSGIKKQ